MSQVPPVTISAASSASASASASPSENNARSQAASSNPSYKRKLRSCVVCRTRKVRCDKLSPCSNCRRANIACVSPSTDRPPRWARRLERVANNAASNTEALQAPDPATAKVIERLRNLEGLVNDLSDQLKQANAASSSAAGGSSGVNSPESSSHDRDTDHQSDALSDKSASNVQKDFGRLVHQDANRSRYVSSGFWSRVKDEVCRSVTFPAVILTGRLADSYYSLMNFRWTATVLRPVIPIPQKTRTRLESSRPLSNLHGRPQNAMHFCFDTI